MHIFILGKLFADNQGKMCYNGGTLNHNTGICTCPALYEGDSCQTRECQPVTAPCWK